MIEINSKPEPYINSVCPLVKPNKNETLQSLLLRKRIAKPEIKEPQYFKEICENCGCTYGAHCAAAYYNKVYKIEIPQDCCPGHEGRMDWDRGPGTAFKSSGIYKEEIC